jgi:NitT/TauT family transport system substrate-binding protein
MHLNDKGNKHMNLSLSCRQHIHLKNTHTRKETYFCLSIVLMISTLLVACINQYEPPIRIGANAWPGYEYLFLAQHKGYYEAEGLNIKLIETASLNDTRRAFERGKIDGMASTAIEVVQAAANSGRIAKIFMIPGFSNGSDVIIANKNINSVNSLKGKRVGMELASLGQYMVARSLQQQNLSLDSIVIVPMQQEEMVRAMNNNKVDAVMAYPPMSIELLKDGSNHVIFSSADIPGEVMDVVALAPEVIAKHPDVPAKILRAWQRTLDFAAANPDEAFQVSASREGISKLAFSEALQGVELLSIGKQKDLFLDGSSIERVLSLVKQIAITPEQQNSVLSNSKLIDSAPLNSIKE